MKKYWTVQNLCFGGVLAALVFVATRFLVLPVPMTNGYVHLGDALVLLGAALCGPVAVPAGALGSMLSDLLSGYTVYALPTFIIKGLVALVALCAFRQQRLWLRALLLLAAEAVMVAGYFVCEAFLMGMGLGTAVADLGGNAIQGLSGVVLALALAPVAAQVRKAVQRG